MEKPTISPHFTVEDIHKVREYNYEMTKNMSREERRAYYRKGSEEFKAYMESLEKNENLAIV